MTHVAPTPRKSMNAGTGGGSLATTTSSLFSDDDGSLEETLGGMEFDEKLRKLGFIMFEFDCGCCCCCCIIGIKYGGGK